MVKKKNISETLSNKNGTQPVTKPFKPFTLAAAIRRRSSIESAPSLIGGVRRNNDEQEILHRLPTNKEPRRRSKA
jgi:hypothetical protein